MSLAEVIAIRLLSRREHSQYELQQKMLQKGISQVDIEVVLAKCQSQGLQSDARFAENLCRTRVRQGYGPIRIRNDLKQTRVSEEIIDSVLALDSSQWLEYAKKVWMKKYQGDSTDSERKLQKQKHFLFYRGFSTETIVSLFKELAI